MLIASTSHFVPNFLRMTVMLSRKEVMTILIIGYGNIGAVTTLTRTLSALDLHVGAKRGKIGVLGVHYG